MLNKIENTRMFRRGKALVEWREGKDGPVENSRRGLVNLRTTMRFVSCGT